MYINVKTGESYLEGIDIRINIKASKMRLIETLDIPYLPS